MAQNRPPLKTPFSYLPAKARGVERESQIVAWDPPQRVTLRSVQGGIAAEYEYRMRKTDGGQLSALKKRVEYADG